MVASNRNPFARHLASDVRDLDAAQWLDAARLANRAASIVVGKFGAATVTIGELSVD